MSENKKHLSKKIIFPLVLVVVAVVVIGCFFAFRKPKDSQSSAPAVDIVAQYDKESYAAALRLEKCPDYNGNYKFTSVLDVSFDEDYSTQQQNIIFQAINGSRDKNEFISKIHDKKQKQAAENEIITLANNKYTKSKNGSTLEYGVFYGNRNKSYVYINDSTGTITIEGIRYSEGFEISLTGYWISNIVSSNNTLYIKEKYKYGTLSDKYLVVTYQYNLI